MKNRFFWKVLLMVVAIFSLAFFTSCGSTIPTGSGEDGPSPNAAAAAAADDETDGDETIEVDVKKVVDFAGMKVNGVDFVFGGPVHEYPLGETITAEITFRFSDPSDAPWSGYAQPALFLNEIGDPIHEDRIELDFTTSEVYPAYHTLSYSYTPTETGSYSLEIAVRKYDDNGDGEDEDYGSYSAPFIITGGLPGPDPIDLGSNCADGSFTLAGIPVVLEDLECDGLIEKYSCNNGIDFVNISHGTTVDACGSLRISNGTPGNDVKDFRWADLSAGVSPKPTIFAGGPGSDYIRGSSADDLILGGPDKDNLQGREENDTIACGSGNDYVKADTGNDVIYGGEGNDHLRGSDGNDEIHGGPGDDFVDGEAGDDRLYGEANNDFVYGDLGDDHMDGGDGDDVCKGGRGNDVVNCGEGSDYCSGGDGNDLINCGAGVDIINARRGNDSISSCDGSADIIDGGEGTNACLTDTGVDTATNCDVHPCL